MALRRNAQIKPYIQQAGQLLLSDSRDNGLPSRGWRVTKSLYLYDLSVKNKITCQKRASNLKKIVLAFLIRLINFKCFFAKTMKLIKSLLMPTPPHGTWM